MMGLNILDSFRGNENSNYYMYMFDSECNSIFNVYTI